MDQAISSRRKGLLTWTFVRALVRIYIAYVEAHLCVGAKVPGWLVNMLPGAERITTGMLWMMITAPEVLAKLRLDRRPVPNADVRYPPLDISDADLRRRIAKIKAILRDPRAETARLKAIAAAHGIKLKKLAGLRPINMACTPSTDDLVHACARARITPQARPPQMGIASAFSIPAGEAPVSAAARAEGVLRTDLSPLFPTTVGAQPAVSKSKTARRPKQMRASRKKLQRLELATRTLAGMRIFFLAPDFRVATERTPIFTPPVGPRLSSGRAEKRVFHFQTSPARIDARVARSLALQKI